MSWIKRNIYFVLSGIIALGLMVGAGFYNFQGWKHNVDMRQKLSDAYATLKTLKDKKPNPGTAEGVDNIKAAREQQVLLRGFFNTNTAKHFERIPSIPDLSKVNSEQFAAALRATVDQLQRNASNASVSLPPKYNFTFEAERSLVKFAPDSLEPLSVSLGEVKVLCDVLIHAKVNSLDGVRRERVSADDAAGPQTDYTDEASQTNNLAVLTPYEITFRCFGPELAAVLAGFVSSPHSFIVKTLSVEPAPAAAKADVTSTRPVAVPIVAAPAVIVPLPVAPRPPPPPPSRVVSPDDPSYVPGEESIGGAPASAPAPAPIRSAPPPPQRYVPSLPAPGPAVRSGPQPLLNEKQLRVTMTVVIVKLLPMK